MHSSREALRELGLLHPEVLDIRDCGRWDPKKKEEGAPRDRMWLPSAAPYLSFEEMAREWAYFVEVEGRGYSARLKVLLFSGRPVLLQERTWCEWWHFELVPWTHYVPVKEDLSDLIQMVEWAKEHPEQAEQIGCGAKAFAESHLTREAALGRWAAALTEAALSQAGGAAAAGP